MKSIFNGCSLLITFPDLSEYNINPNNNNKIREIFK